jgi:hypothetical protein
MNPKTRSPLSSNQPAGLEALYQDLDLFLTQSVLQFDDEESIVVGEIRKELGRLRSQVSRVEKALEGLPSSASLAEVIATLEQQGIIHAGRMSETD